MSGELIFCLTAELSQHLLTPDYAWLTMFSVMTLDGRMFCFKVMFCWADFRIRKGQKGKIELYSCT
jgi:hypothetical protein